MFGTLQWALFLEAAVRDVRSLRWLTDQRCREESWSPVQHGIVTALMQGLRQLPMLA